MSDLPNAKALKAPLYAQTGWIVRYLGLSYHDLAQLRNNGTVFAVKRTGKCWLHRVPDILKWINRGEDGVVRDEQYESHRHSFNPTKEAATAAPGQKMTKEQLRQKCDELHIGYTQKATNEELEALIRDAHARG